MSLENLPDHLYRVFATLGRATSDPTRLRILNLLCQTERSVDDLASRLGHSQPNMSAHLKVLAQANLITRRKEGRYVFYRLTSRRALRLWLALRDMGLQEIPAAREAMSTYAQEPALLPDLWGAELLEKVRSGEVTLLDLRPIEEFEAGHLPGARSLPADELAQRMRTLGADLTIVAYCRGPFCVAAIKSVARLRDAGFDVRRLRGGVAEWLDAGLELDR